MLLSVIIPFRKRANDPDCIRRLECAIECFADVPEVEIVVYDTGTVPLTEYGLSVLNKANLSYYQKPERGVFAPGRVRNHAINKARGRFVFLFDADLLISYSVIEALLKHIRVLEKEGPQAFRMFPCLYLSKSYSQVFAESFKCRELQRQLYLDTLDSYLGGELSRIDGIALASSCLLMQREWFLALGGFRDCFAGHGCEDFDLIHRLSAFYPLGKRPQDYAIDEKSRFPGDYQGFRSYYSRYAFSFLLDKQFLLHQWHPRPQMKNYHRRRLKNESLFQEILKAPVLELPRARGGSEMSNETCHLLAKGGENFASTKQLLPFRKWLHEQLLVYGYQPGNCPGLFYLQKGASPSGVILRKFCKLVFKPKLFFRDMLRKW